MADHTAQLAEFVLVRRTCDQLYDDLARVLTAAAEKAVGERGAFHLALSGGTTPEPFYTRLVIDPRYRSIPWEYSHIWIVDERCVPDGDPEHNFTMIRESLTDHLPMRRRQIHPIHALADDPATDYENELKRHIADGRLDFVVLGMGHDAHTAGLFPRSPAQQEQDRWVAVNKAPDAAAPERVTMTYPLLNAARGLAVLITGSGKAQAVRRVAEQMQQSGPDPVNLPITGVDPVDGQVNWYLDAQAAGSED